MAKISRVKPPIRAEEHPAFGLPGNMITSCENCDILMKKIKDYEKAFEALEKLAEWYESANALGSGDRVRKAMRGMPPVRDKK